MRFMLLLLIDEKRENVSGKDKPIKHKSEGNNSTENEVTRRGMVLPFTPLSLAFDHINYYVDMPAVSCLRYGLSGTVRFMLLFLRT